MESQLITAPAAVLTADECRAHLKVDTNTEDTLIASYLAAATDYVEQESTTCLGSQTWELSSPCWQRRIFLPRKPVQSVTSIKYRDTSNVEQTLNPSSYRLIRSHRHTAYVEIVDGAELPSVFTRSDAIAVRYVAGFATVPPAAVHAVRLALGLFHEDRNGEQFQQTAVAVARLCKLFRGY